MGVIGWIVIGGIAGWLASAVVGAPRSGCVWNIVVGILGAFVGGMLFNATSDRKVVFTWSLSSLAIATIGAIVLLLVINLVMRPGRRGPQTRPRHRL